MMDPTRLWYGPSLLSWFLLPLSWLYCAIVRVRRLGYRLGWMNVEQLAVPVIVVGNLTVGGTGKTPLVLRLAALLQERGWTPGIITRGYRGKAEAWPQSVRPASDPVQVGDEPVLLARRSGCPVVAGPDRVSAGRMAIATGGCDILLSDDGLQHYALGRDLEILVIDAQRGFGNGRCLPAGPLREPVSRRASVDLVVYKEGAGQGHGMRLEPGEVRSLCAPDRALELADFRAESILAVAGIGDPERFFRVLEGEGLKIARRPFPDHHCYTAADVAAWGDRTVIMTEKDAVKCAAFATERHWYLSVEARLDAAFETHFFAKLTEFTRG
ncbi:tetraacyldisaccharide 4'-kinase [Thiocystis violacea]|uniref:tetraacyldisaccharide 4'-kinase n=1 Tax=Thiocystis violacea TaxID=13725 RepID=UPI001F5B71B9|nr:tetraacyldisaccharide 4'-kinase [Thiocystis violacea]MBK1723263.1 tetraacyldisaccharide 4'-kinase [Thiocystis violacea]